MNYALLVGINSYASPDITSLDGCENDVERFESYLDSVFPSESEGGFEIQTLISEQATRQAIIDGFLNHLAQATKGELALFYFSGHGCEEESPMEFVQAQGSSKHENIVCYDSGLPGVYDIADKELNVLIGELAANEAEVIVIFDCCHAGSGTRDKLVQGNGKTRMTTISQARPYPEGFLDGSWQEFTRSPRHLLMAACSPTELSREDTLILGADIVTHGVFTHALISALEEKGKGVRPMISYEDLLYACRHAIQWQIPHIEQTPQLEVAGDIDARRYFLSTEANQPNPNISIVKFTEDHKWKIPMGTIHGLKADRIARFVLFGDSELTKRIGAAQTATIGLFESPLLLMENTELTPGRNYFALATHLPTEKLAVYIEGNKKVFDAIPSVFEIEDGMENLAIILKEEFEAAVDIGVAKGAALYQLLIGDNSLELQYTESAVSLIPDKIPLFSSSGRSNIDVVARMLVELSKWERIRGLEMPETDIQGLADQVEIVLFVDGKVRSLEAGYATLDYNPTINKFIQIEVRARTNNYETLYVAPYYISPNYSVYPITPKDRFNRELGEVLLDKFKLYMPVDKPDYNRKEVIDALTVVFSLQKLPYLNPGARLSMEKLYRTLMENRGFKRDDGNRDRLVEVDFSRSWFTKRLSLKTLLELGEIGRNEQIIADGQIRFEKHPGGFIAKVALASSAAHLHPPEVDRDMKKILSNRGYNLVDFSTQGMQETILEVHHINDKNLLSESAPLRIHLSVDLPPDSSLLALTLPPSIDPQEQNYPGEFVVVGNLITENKGTYQLNLKAIPENPHDGREEEGKSLKISFLIIPEEKQNNLQQALIEADRGTWLNVRAL